MSEFRTFDNKPPKTDGKHWRPSKLPQRACVVCGTEFVPSRKRKEAKYCSKKCIWVATKGPEFNAALARKYNPPRNRASRGSGTKGYVKINGRHEHRVVMEQIVGRPLKFEDVVHHKDENKHNNSPENLELTTRPQHMRMHGLAIPGQKPAHWR